MRFKDITFRNAPFRLFLLFVAICPIFFDPSKSFEWLSLRLNQEQFFQLGCTVLFTIVFIENIYLCLAVLYSILLYSYYNFPVMSAEYVTNLFWAALLYQVSYVLFTDQNIKTFFKVMIGVCLLNIVWLILQATGNDLIYQSPTIHGYSREFVGLMGIKCFMGILFAMCIPFLASFGRWQRWASALFLIPCYLSHSSVAMVGGIAAFLWTFWWESRKAFFALLVILSIGGAFYVANDHKTGMFDNRYSLWRVTLRRSMEHPLIGWGLNSFSKVGSLKQYVYMNNPRTHETKDIPYTTLKAYMETGQFPKMDFVKEGDTLDMWEHPHNEFISLFNEWGLLGLLLFGFFSYDVYQGFFLSRQMIALSGFLIVILITATGQYPLHVARIGYLVPVVLGAYYKLIYLNKKESEHVTS